MLTVFAGSPPPERTLSPFARSLHARWQASIPPNMDFSDPPAARRAEDVRAFAAISPAIQAVHLLLPECIYRTDAPANQALYTSEEAIFGEVHPADPAIQALRAVPALPAGSTLYVPLGVGHHVDHQIVRKAADGWGIPVRKLRFYEEYPYGVEPGAVETALEGDCTWRPLVTALSEDDLAAKVRAIAKHESQISTFWQNAEMMEDGIRSHAAQIGGERMWVRRSAGRRSRR